MNVGMRVGGFFFEREEGRNEEGRTQMEGEYGCRMDGVKE